MNLMDDLIVFSMHSINGWTLLPLYQLVKYIKIGFHKCCVLAFVIWLKCYLSRFVLSCGKDSTVKLWEVGTGRLVKQYLGATHTQLRCQVCTKGLIWRVCGLSIFGTDVCLDFLIIEFREIMLRPLHIFVFFDIRTPVSNLMKSILASETISWDIR
jgi:WD40 repeat protein